jgi:Na+(H+)/acetate symporter ActP
MRRRVQAIRFAWHLGFHYSNAGDPYVLQAISTVSDGRKAQASSLYTALLLIRFGIFAALVGMCAAVLFPKIDSLQAFPTIIAQMDNVHDRDGGPCRIAIRQDLGDQHRHGDAALKALLSNHSQEEHG